jgi:hypothetical protein
VQRRCSYLTLGARGTCLAFGTAIAQDGAYVTVVPDGGGDPLRLLAAYVDFNPLFDPYHFIPPAAQQIIDRFGLTPQPQPNATPRQGERATHTTATRLWTGPAVGIDDGYAWIEAVTPLGWRPSSGYGAWPEVVECFRVHDPKDDPDQSGRWFVHMRLTYLERGLYLAFYITARAARDDAWKSPDA